MNRPSMIVLVRHGESQRNVAIKGNAYFTDNESRESLKGIADHNVPITELGWQQAVKTGEVIRSKFGRFDYIYHSGYQRTVETAQGILQAYSEEERAFIKVRHNLFIRERDPGFAYDMTTAEAEAAFPWLNHYWKTFGSFFAQPPGGESLAQVCERVYLFLNMLFRDRAGLKILVVTHGGTMRAFRFLLERWNYDEAEDKFQHGYIENCSVTVYEYVTSERRLVLKELNQVYWY